MRNALKLIAILACAFNFVTLSAQTLPGLPVLPTTLNLERLKVSQQTVFQGNVVFDQGLNLTGHGNFLNDVNVLGGISVGKAVVFPALPQVDYVNTLITGDPNGNITKVPLEVLARELAKRGLPPLENLSVTKVTTLNGDVFLGQGLNINGTATFAHSVITKGTFSAYGDVAMTGLTKGSVKTGVSVLGIDNGKVVTLDLTDLGQDPTNGNEPCLINLPAAWRYAENRITTDRCSNDVKVGINTLAPKERLDVNGNVWVNNGLFVGRRTNTSGITSEFAGKVAFGGNYDGTELSRFVSLSAEGGYPTINGEGDRPLRLNYSINNDVEVGQADQSNSKLTAFGGAFIGKHTTSDQNINKGELMVTGANGFVNTGDHAPIFFGDRNHSIRSVHGKGLLLGTFQGSNAIVVAQGGNIGIGRDFDAINAKLHIEAKTGQNALEITTGDYKQMVVTAKGELYAKEVTVQLSGFPDYVFEPTYKLMSLNEIDAFIKANGHLPNMPSAAEVEKDGADLGELVKKLVEKNEELTLHLIRMQKELDELKAKK